MPVRGPAGTLLFAASRHPNSHRLRMDEPVVPGYGLTACRQGTDVQPDGAAAGPAVHDLDGAGRLLPADQILGPPASVEPGVDQLGAGVRFAPRRHAARYSRALPVAPPPEHDVDATDSKGTRPTTCHG